ncbi:hypothetical protein EDB19DRAFT_1911035 [Suillus lakei]|nr:hypothetical protein EDB19DRAFT_1911035 [Suillus lakei]
MLSAYVEHAAYYAQEETSLHFEYTSVVQRIWITEPNLLNTRGYEPPSERKFAISLLAPVLLGVPSIVLDCSSLDLLSDCLEHAWDSRADTNVDHGHSLHPWNTRTLTLSDTLSSTISQEERIRWEDVRLKVSRSPVHFLYAWVGHAAVGGRCEVGRWQFNLPLLVIVGWIVDQPLMLRIHNFETIILCVCLPGQPVTHITCFRDGKANYMEGHMLRTLHLVIALLFWVARETINYCNYWLEIFPDTSLSETPSGLQFLWS